MARLARLVPLVPIALTLFVSAPAQASPLIEAFGAVGGNAGEQGVVAGPGCGVDLLQSGAPGRRER